jgi:hypothetical protein
MNTSTFLNGNLKLYVYNFMQGTNLMKPIMSHMYCGSRLLDIQGLVALLEMTPTEVDVIVGTTTIIGHEAVAAVADESETTPIVR